MAVVLVVDEAFSFLLVLRLFLDVKGFTARDENSARRLAGERGLRVVFSLVASEGGTAFSSDLIYTMLERRSDFVVFGLGIGGAGERDTGLWDSWGVL